jgi:predicted nucleotidyltransferase
MISGHLSTRARIAHVANKLDHLLDEVVFVGGAVVELLVTDPAAKSFRPTLDIDTVIELTSRAEYYSLEDDLRRLGFVQQFGEDLPICRWYIDSIPVDFMPDIPEILGFTNRWYHDAVANSISFDLDDKARIRIISGPYFLASKIEAFLGRGNGDYLTSPDIEDIIALVDGRASIVEEVEDCPSDLTDYLSARLRVFTSNEQFIDSIPGHLLPDEASQGRIPLVLERITAIVGD